MSGPETAGQRLRLGVNGEIVQLPSDTYIEAVVARVLCRFDTKCPSPPIYTLVRGDARITFSSVTGEVYAQSGDPHTFEFLNGVLTRGTP